MSSRASGRFACSRSGRYLFLLPAVLPRMVIASDSQLYSNGAGFTEFTVEVLELKWADGGFFIDLRLFRSSDAFTTMPTFDLGGVNVTQNADLGITETGVTNISDDEFQIGTRESVAPGDTIRVEVDDDRDRGMSVEVTVPEMSEDRAAVRDCEIEPERVEPGEEVTVSVASLLLFERTQNAEADLRISVGELEEVITHVHDGTPIHTHEVGFVFEEPGEYPVEVEMFPRFP